MNHLLDCIAGGRVSYVFGTARAPLPADESALKFLNAGHAALKRRARQFMVLPSARADLPVFMACTAAWDLQGQLGGKSTVVLVTAQPDALEVCHHHHLPAHALPRGRHNMLNVAQLGRRIQNVAPRLKPAKGDFEFRLVITDHFTPDLAAAMHASGIQVEALIIDGRTIDAMDVHAPADVPALHLAVSRVQVLPGWTQADVIEPVAQQHGRLQCLKQTPTKPRGHQIPDPNPRLWTLLDRLRRHRSAAIFLQEGWGLAWLLNGLPVNPDHVDKQYLVRAGYQAHPLFGSLDVLKAVRDGTRDEAVKADMTEFIHEAEQAILALKAANPKHARVVALAKESPGSLVLVNGNGVRAALQRDLDAHGTNAKAVTWRDPATWMPHDGRVIFASSPPPDRTWVTAAQWPISPDVHFVLTRAESRRLRSALSAIGIKGGAGFRALEELEAQAKAAPDQADAVPDDIHSWLKEHALLGTSHSAADGKDADGTTMMRMLKLASGDRYYARANGEMARFEPSGIRMVPVMEVKPGDVVLLASDAANPNVVEAMMAKFEAHEPEHRRRINEWKAEVIAKAEGMTPAQLTATLSGLGAPGLTIPQIIEIFWDRTKFAPQDETFLIRATQVFLGHPIDCGGIGHSIQRLRGMRRHAPRILNRYAKMSFVTTHDELHSTFEAEYGLTHKDVQSLVRPNVVASASPPLPCPQTFAGFYSEDVNA